MSSIKSARAAGRTHPAGEAFLGDPGSKPAGDSVAVIMDFVPMAVTEYEQMVDRLKMQRRDQPTRALFHWYRVHPDGIRVIEIWPSRSAFVCFLEGVLEPLVNDLGLPEPHLSCHDVPRVAHHG